MGVGGPPDSSRTVPVALFLSGVVLVSRGGLPFGSRPTVPKGSLETWS